MKNRKIWVPVLVLLVVALLLVWAQSLLPPAVSSGESDFVAGICARLFGTTSDFARFLQTYVRKIAHFAEYAVLGFLTMLALFVNRKHRDWRFLLGGFVFGVLVAVIDENIQRFSGRHPAVLDVLIDVLGFSSFYLLTRLFLGKK